MLRISELEMLFTANIDQVRKADKDVKSIGERIEKKPVTAKINADEKDALAGMNRVETAAKKLVSSETALKLDADISKAEKSLDRAKQRLADLEVRALGGLDVTADVKRAEAALQKIERNVKGLTDARQMIEVDASTVLADAVLEGLEQRARRAGDDAGRAGGRSLASGLDSATRGAGERVGALVGGDIEETLVDALAAIPIAGGIVLAGVAIGKAVIGGIQDGLQQEVGRDRLQGLTGISEEEAASHGRAAGEAYANLFGTSIEANMDTARLALQFNIIDADTVTRDSQRVIEGLAGVADALGEDVRPVAQAVSILLQTGLARSAEHAYDLLATGAREGLNRNEDLLDTLTEYPAVFRRLGLTGDEALGLMNQGMRDGARNSDLMADALKEFQIRATDATEMSAEGYRLLGLNASAMTAQIARGGDDAARGLDTVLDKLRATEDPVVRNAAAVALFGTKAEDLGEALFAMDLSTAVDELNGVEGAAQRMFDTLASNDASSIQTAQRNIEVAADGIKGALAAAFSEPLGDFADWVSQNRGPLTEFLLGLANGALDFGRSMVIAASDGTVALGEFVSGPLRDTVVGLRDFLEWLPGEQDLTGLDSLIEDMGGFDEATSAAADSMRDRLIPGIDEAQERMNLWADPIVQLGYLNDASRSLAEAVDAVGFAADGSRLSMEGFDASNARATESGAALEDQVRTAVAALSEEIDAAGRAGESQEQLAGRYNTARDALVGQMEQMGLTREQAQQLIDTVLATPPRATTAYSSNAREEQGRVEHLANRITTLPDGSVVITANTGPAQNSIDYLWRRNNGRVIRMNVQVGQSGVGGGAVGSDIYRQAQGGILEFMAAGGIRGLTPMAPIAQVVPASSWRVVGDRSDVAESYIPLDGSARSMAILLETMRRMGVLPMASGGITSSGSSSSAGGPTQMFGRLYLESGAFLGVVRGEIAAADRAAASRSAAGMKGRYA